MHPHVLNTLNPDLLNSLVSPIFGGAVFLTAVSTVVIVIVDFVKNLTRPRMFVLRRSMRTWTACSDRSAGGLLIDLPSWYFDDAFGSQVVAEKALGELLLLAADGHRMESP